MFGNPARGENRSISRRRAAEYKWQNAMGDVLADNSVRHKTNWEINTQKVIGRNTIVNIARGQKSIDDAKLLQRRERLAKLFEDEDQVFRQELAALQETSEQRASRLIDRAKKLKATREAKTREIVQKTYERQWREGCDDLRMIESERFRMHCHEEVSHQRKEKAAQESWKAQEEKRWADMWEDNRQTRIQREKKERRDKQAALHDNRNALLAQMAEARRIRADQARQNAKDRNIFQEQMEQDADEARREQAKAIADQRQLMSETKAVNEAAQARRKDIIARQRDEERRLLDHQMMLLEKENKQKAVNKKAKRDDITRYRAFLIQQREADRVKESEIDQLIQEDLAKANHKHDLQHQREELARQKLLENVFSIRAQQLQEKEQRLALDGERMRQEKVAMKDAVTREMALVKLEEDEERQLAMQHRKDIEKQIQMNRTKQNLATARVALDKEFAEQAEAQYRTFLDRERKSQTQRYRPQQHGRTESQYTRHAQAVAPKRAYDF